MSVASYQTHDRASWISTLARSTRQAVEALWPEYDEPCQYEWLRRPHTGLVMVQGRAGGTGNAFNLGEMTVTRCALQLNNGFVGHGYVQGRDKRHAELAARLDALLQDENQRADLLARVITPLQQHAQNARQERSRKAASTKVDFLTMVREQKQT